MRIVQGTITEIADQSTPDHKKKRVRIKINLEESTFVQFHYNKVNQLSDLKEGDEVQIVVVDKANFSHNAGYPHNNIIAKELTVLSKA